MESHFAVLERHPEYHERLAALESATRERTDGRVALRVAGPVSLSVVVHVVYSQPVENISIQQIQSQIDALNRDYNAQNPDRAQTPACWNNLVGNANVSFRLATVDPTGAVTNGVTRTPTTTTGFSASTNDVKSAATGGADPWPSDRYLNIWVCPLGGGLLGYAQFPGMPPATDGVVILHSAFGTQGTAAEPYNLGRSATHEIGHWLNLIHIWGDTDDCSGSDNVGDTPTQQSPNFGVPAFPHISCNNGPNGDMFMNYMDYVDDHVMVMFTLGQVVRMQATLDTERSVIAQAAAGGGG
jgi:hypothetical protein